MAGMKRFVTYIYAYEEARKGNNVGFAKVEIRGAELRMEIHMRGVYAAQTECRVYLFREVSGDMEGVQIGELRLANGAGDYGVILNAGRIKDTPFGIGDMEGIFLRTGDDRIFMSRWKEGAPLTVDGAHFKEWQPAPPRAEEAGQIAADARTQPNTEESAVADAKPRSGEAGQTAADAKPRSGEAGRTRKVQPGVDVPPQTAAGDIAGTREQKEAPQTTAQDIAGGWEQKETPQTAARDIAYAQKQGATRMTDDENVQATEIPMRNFFPDYSWEEIWDRLCKEHPLLAPLADREARCIQIELKDLKELPKKYWYLGNNSFLLHGFFNYRYLVVGKTGEERWFIGVPGIYQRQERVMAAIFGFPEFLAAAVQGDDPEAQEGEPVNRFGCWCRYIEE
ncbi:MAG: hypothetical protein J6K53_09515 [Roseburia sp.]|nr:hypothetical protein [Roseburia sp.]